MTNCFVCHTAARVALVPGLAAEQYRVGCSRCGTTYQVSGATAASSAARGAEDPEGLRKWIRSKNDWGEKWPLISEADFKKTAF